VNAWWEGMNNRRLELWTAANSSDGPWTFEGEFSHCSAGWVLKAGQRAADEGRKVVWICEAGKDAQRPEAHLPYAERAYAGRGAGTSYMR